MVAHRSYIFPPSYMHLLIPPPYPHLPPKPYRVKEHNVY